MKRSEIVIGGVYSNGSDGRYRSVRKVLDRGPQYALHDKQEDLDCLQYEVLDGRGKGQIGTITRTSFSHWAKERLS